jgi:hypothetical protein
MLRKRVLPDLDTLKISWESLIGLMIPLAINEELSFNPPFTVKTGIDTFCPGAISLLM